MVENERENSAETNAATQLWDLDARDVGVERERTK